MVLFNTSEVSAMLAAALFIALAASELERAKSLTV